VDRFVLRIFELIIDMRNQDKNILIQFVINNERCRMKEICVGLNRNLDNHWDRFEWMVMNVNDDLKRLKEE